MTDVTRILMAIDRGESAAAEELLPLVYRELRALAAARLAKERAGQTIQPTALVHEAYVRLVDVQQPQQWNGRGHFFAAAAEAMRRILVERARRKRSQKHGGRIEHTAVEDVAELPSADRLDLLALDEALAAFEQRWPDKAALVKLRYFAGLTSEEAAQTLGIRSELPIALGPMPRLGC